MNFIHVPSTIPMAPRIAHAAKPLELWIHLTTNINLHRTGKFGTRVMPTEPIPKDRDKDTTEPKTNP